MELKMAGRAANSARTAGRGRGGMYIARARVRDPAARRRAQHAYIRRADADIIFLQECQETELELPQMFI